MPELLSPPLSKPYFCPILDSGCDFILSGGTSIVILSWGFGLFCTILGKQEPWGSLDFTPAEFFPNLNFTGWGHISPNGASSLHLPNSQQV